MPTYPITFLEKKWAATSSNNSLIEAATQTTDRENISNLDFDTHRIITSLGRRTLMIVGRFLYENCGILRGTIDEIARLATITWIPQYYGSDKAWKKQAEEFIYDTDGSIDIRGGPYSQAIYLQNLVRETLVDGDLGTLMATVVLFGGVEVPRYQTWRSHRIGSRSSAYTVPVGQRYAGMRLIDGAVVDDFGRAVAYGLIGENSWQTEPFEYVSTNNFFLSFLPSHSDQCRGFSAVASSAFNWQDVKESRNFWLIAQKIAATVGATVHNETGIADRTKALLSAPATAADSSGNAQSLPQELVQPGRIMYFKANTGQKIEFPKDDRPSPNAMEYQDEVVREGMHSLGWNSDFSLKPGKPGGSELRAIIQKINARLQEIRQHLVSPACRRLTPWRIRKAINAGLLPDNDEWWKWSFQGPAELTADRKYESQIDLEESARGILTDEQLCAKRGGDMAYSYEQTEVEATERWERARRVADKFGITVEAAYASLWSRSNPAPATAAPAQEPQPEEKAPLPRKNDNE